MGTLRFYKCDLYGGLFVWKGLGNVTFNSPFLNLKSPISETFKLLKVLSQRASFYIYHTIQNATISIRAKSIITGRPGLQHGRG